MATAFDPSKYQLDQIPQIIEELQAHLLSKRAETLTAAATAYMTAVHNHKISLLEAVQALDTVEKLAAAGITFSSGKSSEKNGPISAKPRRARLPFPKEFVIKNPEPKGRELKEYTVGKVPVPQWVYRGIEAGTIKP
ncbi:hypothetical protein [Variovorax sp. LG9.2]|uniref:hypothetical protein n=1 Tax=Variovorax sp. LG9.2 TaxID=3048626 RepID=UPI002B23C85E|nr:hypothetical protein [Variovorax sp. LG9.2]MEB0057287.1 hypothetical protein [Variovorax sp. LG9.2]